MSKIKTAIYEMGDLHFPRELTEEELKKIAYHEAGHGLLHTLFEKEFNDDKLISLSIVPRGTSLGITRILDVESLPTIEELKREISFLMGGYAAEKVKGLKISESFAIFPDLKKATRIATNLATYEHPKVKNACNETRDEFDSRVENLITQAHETATKMITTHEKALDALAQKLIKKGFLSGNEVRRIVEENPPG